MDSLFQNYLKKCLITSSLQSFYYFKFERFVKKLKIKLITVLPNYLKTWKNFEKLVIRHFRHKKTEKTWNLINFENNLEKPGIFNNLNMFSTTFQFDSKYLLCK